jgi:Methylase involved in ubiquinone/menaquinone biosynthesis
MSETKHSHLAPGTLEYDEHVRAEIEHYRNWYNDSTLLQTVPQSWVEIEQRSSNLIRATTGNAVIGHVVSKLNRRPSMRMLSLGCGPGGVEINLAQQARSAEIQCIDINPEALERGRQRARELGLNMSFQVADLNTIELPANEFDMVFCYAALHHVIELEWLADQIKKTLRSDGEFVTVDIITRNGYLMWPETRETVRAIFRTLPERFRLNHIGYAQPQIDDEIWEKDTSVSGMECIRSEDILTILGREFTNEMYVPYLSICRRFFDSMYGPNYDLKRPLDLAILEWLWELDNYYLDSKRLRPETFFGTYRK